MRVTASKVGLLSCCQWFAREDATWDPYRSSPAAERGTRFHKAIAEYVDTGEMPEVEDDIRDELAHACAWVLSYGRELLRAEVKYAWDPSTDAAEELSSVGDRDYSQAAGRLAGTADIVSVSKAMRAGYVADWKTGDGSGAGPQLRALGLMLARVHGLDSVTVAALEVRASGVTEVAREELDAFALAGVAGELAEQLAAIESAEPQPGSHCGELYCPARLSCPVGTAATAEVAAIVPVESLTKKYRITDPIQSADQAIWTLDVMRLMGAWLDAKKDEIKALVPADGWATEDGRVLKDTRATIEAFDKGKAQALLRELGATDEQIGRCFYQFEKSNGLRVSGGATKPRKRSRAA